MADDATTANERQLLCALMWGVPATVDAVTPLVSLGTFADARHREIFAAVTANRGADQPTTPDAVASTLRQAKALKKAGLLPYLAEVYDAGATGPQAVYYARLVAEAAELRDAEADGIRLKQAAESGDIGAVERVRTSLVERWNGPTTGASDSDSWTVVDLDPYLSGQISRPEPTVGIARSDGLRLLYPGKEHAVIGEMESGKTWLICACVVAEIEAGNHVLYVHYEEPDPQDTVERLLTLGLHDQQIRKFLRFVAPTVAVTAAKLAKLLDPAPSLVIHDGVNEAMAMHRMAIREEDGAAAFRQHLVAPCLRVGAATLAADHVVKDKETRGRYQIGSVHKGNGLTGVLILLDNAEPFGRGQRGRSHVYVTKDRPGHLRRHGRPDRVTGKTFLGELVVDDTGRTLPCLDLQFHAPNAPAETVENKTSSDTDTTAVLAAVRAIIAKGKPATLNAVRASSGISHTRTDHALERLILDDVLAETAGSNRSRLFSVPEDQLFGDGE